MSSNTSHTVLLTPEEADARIGDFTPLLPQVSEELSRCGERVLRQPLLADSPLPRGERVCMDGIAVRWREGQRSWLQRGRQCAGSVPLQLKEAEGAIEVATGAICPEGADTVIPYESLQQEGHRWTLRPGVRLLVGKNIQAAGSEQEPGQLLLKAFTRLGAPELCLLAAAGCAEVAVSAKPRISLIANGSELVPLRATPLPHQTRECNNTAAEACLGAFHYDQIQKALAADDGEQLIELVRSALATSDVLILSGGISSGPQDLVRTVLRECEVKEVFFQVAQKPGRPLWFGVSPQGQPVFGLPGNPVAALVNLRRYVLPTLARMEGQVRPVYSLPLGQACEAQLAQFIPVRLPRSRDGSLVAEPVSGRGSGDFTSLRGTSGFVYLEKGSYAAGHLAPFYGWTP